MSNADITVTGNLTVDPELKIGAGGAGRLGFSIASNKRFQRDGEWVEETSFFNVVAWRTLAERSAEVLEKGMPVMIKGRLEQRSWEDNDGNKRSTVEIVADTIAVNIYGIESMERRRGNGGGSGQSGSANRSGGGNRSGGTPSHDPFEDF